VPDIRATAEESADNDVFPLYDKGQKITRSVLGVLARLSTSGDKH